MVRKKVEMSDLVLDATLINEFREQVNSNYQFKQLCQNIDKKNKLNVIYSAMDWINVAVEGTKHLDIEVGGIGYNHHNTINIMQYVMLADLIFESVRQIYRVFEVFELKYPYAKKSDIFNHQKLSDDDNFKHLRAIFGIHPVNLNSIDGVKEQVKNKRYYASWVAHGLVEDDFQVQIYGNSIDHNESTTIGIKLAEIDTYVRERYDLLSELIKVPISIKEEHFNQFKDKGIKLTSDHIQNVKILIDEDKERSTGFRGYSYILQYMLAMFKVDIDNAPITFDKEVLQNYLSELESKIPTITSNLEQMTFQTVKMGIRARGYEFEKIADYFDDQEHPIGEEYFIGLVNHGDLPDEFLEMKDFNLYKLVYDAYLFSKMDGKNYLTYEELIKDNMFIKKGSLGYTGYFF